MPKFKIRITQVYRVEKSIVVESEADTAEDAVENSSDLEAPCSSDDRWTDHWSLENEEHQLMED